VNLLLIGLNHKTAPVEVRECLAPPPEELPAALRRIMALEGVREAMLVSTCNRVEVLAACEGDPQRCAEEISRWLCTGRGLAPEQVEPCLYHHQDREAVRHLFRVASSLDSLVVGEPQILGQIKQAFRAAAEAGATHTVLNRLLHKTFQVAKRVRSETDIGGAAVSISYAAVELARKIFDDLSGLTALLVGAGEMAELAAEHLLGHGVSRLLVANRTLERALELARGLGRGRGEAHPLEDLAELLPRADIVITSTGSPRPILGPETVRPALRARRGRPVFFIDIAVPRDVDPAVGQIDGCFLYDIDDLAQVVEANRAARRQAARQAEGIVAEEVVKFEQWLRSLEVVPTISALVHKAEDIRRAELARTLRQLGPLSPEQQTALDNLTRALVKKLLHDPIMFLKASAHDKSPETKRSHLALVRRIFRLGEDEPRTLAAPASRAAGRGKE
jgi:glutamyl-tRNA reductase